MALTSVVVFDVFICCRGDENKKKKTEARGEEEIQGGKARERTMQRIVLAEPSVFHLFKLMEGNRKQRETEELQSEWITC